MRDDLIYLYSNKVLRCIAEQYFTLYLDGVSFKEGDRITDSASISEYLADFERGVSHLGQKWVLLNDFKEYRSWNRLQRIVAADIFGIPDNILEDKYHFINPERLRQIAYSRVKRFLNGDVITMANIIYMKKQLDKVIK
jgi:hypothetical protein